MIDEHATPPELKGNNLAEIHKERMETRVDKWTLAWWDKQNKEILKAYRGICHIVNLIVSNTRETLERLVAMEKQVDERLNAVEDENLQMIARLGELQAENTLLRSENSALSKRMDDMAAWAAKIEKKTPKA